MVRRVKSENSSMDLILVKIVSKDWKWTTIKCFDKLYFFIWLFWDRLSPSHGLEVRKIRATLLPNGNPKNCPIPSFP